MCRWLGPVIDRDTLRAVVSQKRLSLVRGIHGVDLMQVCTHENGCVDGGFPM